MNYVWDVAIRAKENDIPFNDVLFKVAKSYSPYMELSFENINLTTVEPEVEINPFYRHGYFKIFKDMFDINYEENIEFRNKLFDIAIHFLAEIDIMQGMNKIEYYFKFILRDISRGMFGQKVKERIELFSKQEKDIIARNILRLYITGEALYLLKDTIRKIFKNSIVYANYEVKDELLFYICREKDDIGEAKVELIKDIFLPIKFRTEIYWKDHFGIIETEETMRIDSIALY